MKSLGLATTCNQLRVCLNSSTSVKLATPFGFLRSRHQSSAPQHNQQTVPHVTPNQLLPINASGKKFKDLAQDLNQRSLSLVELEAIQLPSSYHDQKTHENDKSKVISSGTGGSDTIPRRKRRTDFEPDPQFKFERKRGKKHIMLQLKQAKLNGGSTQSTKIELVDHLDLSIRWNGRLNKLLFSLPLPPSEKLQSNPSPSLSSNDDSIDHQKTSTTPQDQKSEINEFIKLCLGPLVWSNPKVDISLVYHQDQSKPTITFWMAEETADGSSENQKVKKVEIEGYSRSKILKLVLNQENRN
ncbi:hypothetical protein PTTG_12055 [Puccinia triticina 1-1 BBBD Race 1]|uniref:Uncharacterized protein n=2 Tax=Puccinia triticina TaxID=208348 RepID=A0A180GW88_PUCT1|nr:uncharacterized protein PtA15_7A756 [Puccinia triticina]OAV96253.1 hypothetical protein PTTG_12055 [Puccinia triticina 1-1 BBBD Race 1]WAQ87027.1 hypothetical protein PtA15_7A756 [Puccinia triticina]WAR56883.1 hypothetical protein PtB15_7B735 [Puccinia triticina]